MATVWRSQSAFARLFAGKTGQILNNASYLGAKLAPGPQSVILSKKYSSYSQSPFIDRIKNENYEYDVVKKPPEWAYVQRLLPFETIPAVKPKDSYPSGWIPPKEEARNLPYFLRRSKNHTVPVYLKVTYRGMRKITIIRKIEGDIWLLNDEIKSYLIEKNKKIITTRVQEVGRFIEIKGDFVNDLFEWAHSKGF